MERPRQTGIFYRPGVKANVLFFDRKPAAEAPWTRSLWVYDLRTNQHFTLKQNPITADDLRHFVESFNPDNRYERNDNERFRCFTYEELLEREKLSLDLIWLRADSLEGDDLPEPEILAQEIADDLEAALGEIVQIAESLHTNPTG